MTAACYDHRIRLHLYQSRVPSSSDELDRAFAVLDDIKSAGLTPLIDTYASLAWTLKGRADPRMDAVLKEAREAGYGDLRARIGLHRRRR